MAQSIAKDLSGSGKRPRGQTSNALCLLPSIDYEDLRDSPLVSMVWHSIDVAGLIHSQPSCVSLIEYSAPAFPKCESSDKLHPCTLYCIASYFPQNSRALAFHTKFGRLLPMRANLNLMHKHCGHFNQRHTEALSPWRSPRLAKGAML